MPSKNYAVERGGPERVRVSWEGAFKEVTLTFDSQPLGFYSTADELANAQTLALPDGSRLEVQIGKFGPIPELRIARDGEPLPGSPGDPVARLADASNMLFAVAALNVLFGLITAIGDIGFLKAMGLGWGSVVAGVAYASLALMVGRRSQAALAAAVILFILDGLFSLVAAAEAKASPPVGGMIARVLFLVPMVRGFAAIKDLQKPARRRPSRPRSPVSTPKTLTPTPTQPAPSSPLPAARTLAGEAEKRRLQMPEGSRSSMLGAPGRRVEVKGPPGVDTARKSLRFVAHKVEIGEETLRVTLPGGGTREVPFAAIARIVARQLPPDPPWDGAFLIDAAPSQGSPSGPDPVRIFPTTAVNYAAIPGGGSTSRLENTRRLTAFLRDRCPGAEVDEATTEFIKGPKVPLRFANMTQFIEYDATYG